MFVNCNLPNGQINFNEIFDGSAYILVTPDGRISVYMNDATKGHASYSYGDKSYRYNVTQI
jgi:hypothetical protein